MATEVHYSSQAAKDLERLDRATQLRVKQALAELAEDPLPANLDVKAIRDHRPWRRHRVGEYRIIFRDVGVDELREAGYAKLLTVRLVGRVVNRRELVRAVKKLRDRQPGLQARRR